MKIAWLINAHQGTGGGRKEVIIADELHRRGYDIAFYSAEGAGNMYDSEVPTYSLKAARGDVVLCSDMGRNYTVFQKFQEIKASLKVWRLALMTREFDPVFLMDDVVKIATTKYFTRELNKMNATNIVEIIGPVDDANFKPDWELVNAKSNVVLIYAKKAGWIGPVVAACIHEMRPSVIIGAFGYSSLGNKAEWDEVIALGCPFLNCSTPAHRTEILNYIYNTSAVYAEVCGGASWGFNNMVGETMLCNCPVVSTDWEGIDHLVIDNETALTVPGNEAPELPGQDWMVRPKPQKVAEKVIQIMEDIELRNRLTANAHAHVSQYTIKNWVDRFEKEVLI